MVLKVYEANSAGVAMNDRTKCYSSYKRKRGGGGEGSPSLQLLILQNYTTVRTLLVEVLK